MYTCTPHACSLYLCLKRGHTWSKGGGTGDDVEEGNGSSLLPRRSVMVKGANVDICYDLDFKANLIIDTSNQRLKFL